MQDDIDLLSERYDVRVFEFGASAFATRARRLAGLGLYGLRQLRWLLRELPEADLVYGWFADYHLFLPVLLARRFGVPVVVVLGGMDCNWLPELNYGVWNSSWRARLTRLVVQQATLLTAVSSSLLRSEENYSAWPRSRVNGIRAHVPALETPCQVIPLGFDPEQWPAGAAERDPIVTTVAHIDSERTLLVKGIDLFIETARHLPEVVFQVVGVSAAFSESLREHCQPPENVRLLPPRPRSALRSIYAETSVYAQLSRVEAFGCVIAEAMLCGCVPAVSDVGGMPGIVDDAGIILKSPKPSIIAGSIRSALDETSPEKRRAARRRITEHYTREQRREALFNALAYLS